MKDEILALGGATWAFIRCETGNTDTDKEMKRSENAINRKTLRITMSKTMTTTLVMNTREREREKNRTYKFIEIDIGWEWALRGSVCIILICTRSSEVNRHHRHHEQLKQTQEKKSRKMKKKKTNRNFLCSECGKGNAPIRVRVVPGANELNALQCHRHMGRNWWIEGDKQEKQHHAFADSLQANATTTDVVN